MPFAADSIGFFLQADDQLSPALRKAESNYVRYVKALERLNRHAYDVVSKGMGKLGTTMQAANAMPTAAAGGSTSSQSPGAGAATARVAQQVHRATRSLHERSMTKAVSDGIIRAFRVLSKAGIFFPVRQMQSGINRIASGGIGPVPKPPPGPPPVPTTPTTPAAQVNNATGWWAKLSALLGPARYLALNRAIGSVSAGFKQLVEAGHQWLGGTGKIEDFVTGFNQINKMIGVNRHELRELKQDVADTAVAYKGAFDLGELSEAFEALRRTGVTDLKLIKDLAPAIAAMNVATTAGRDTIAQFFKELNYGTKLGQTDFKDLAASVAEFSRISGEDADRLTSSMSANVADMRGYLLTQSTDVQKAMLGNLAKFSASVIAVDADTGNEIGSILSRALTGDLQALQDFNQLTAQAFSPEQLAMILKTGRGIDDLIRNIQENAKNLAASGGLRTLSGDILPGLDVKSLTGFAARGDQAIKVLHQLDKASIESGKGMDYLAARALNVNTTWVTWVNHIMNSIGAMDVFGVKGVDVINFFKEFGLQNLHSTIFIAKTTFEMLRLGSVFSLILSPIGAAASGMWGWIKSLLGFAKPAAAAVAAANTVATTTTVAAAATTTAVGSLGKSIAAFGAGVGTLIAEIGTGIGTGLLGALAGLAGGIEALGAAVVNPVGLAGFAALTALIFSFATAARIATPAFEVFGRVAQHGMDVVSEMFKTFMGAGAGAMIAVGPALIGIGVGFTAMATGVFTGAHLLALSVPALTIFAGATAALGYLTGGSAKGISGAIEGIAAAFTVDPEKMRAAEAGVNATVGFLIGFAKASVLVNVLGTMHAGGVIGTVGGWIRDFLLGDPLQNIAEHANDVKKTIVAVANTFGDVDAKKMTDAAASMKPVGEFAAAYARMDSAVRSVTPTGGLWGAIKAVFTGPDALNLLGLEINSTMLRRTIDFLANEVAMWKNNKNLPQAVENLKPVAEFVGAYGKLVAGLKAAGNFNTAAAVGSGAGGLWSTLMYVFAGDDAVKLIAAAPTIKLVVESLLLEFGDPVFTALATMTDDAKVGIKVAADTFTALTPMLNAAADTGKAADAITIGRLHRWFGGRDNLERLKEILPRMKDVLSTIAPNFATIDKTVGGIAPDRARDTMLTTVNMLTGYTAAAKELSNMGGVVRTNIKDIDEAAFQFGKINQILGDVARGAAAVQTILTGGGITPSMDPVAQVGGMIKSSVMATSSLGDLGRAFTANAKDIDVAIQNKQKLADALVGVAQINAQLAVTMAGTAGAADNEIGRLVPQVQALQQNTQLIGKLWHDLNVPQISAGQIQQAVAVSVQGRVDAEDAKTHELLGQLIDIVSKGPVNTGGNRASAPLPSTSAFAAGRG